jgi:glycosyltransferase involved in cell wall biosynthesis
MRVLILTEDLGGGTGNHVLGMTKRWRPVRCQARVLSQAPLRARHDPAIPVDVVRPRRLEGYPLAQVRRLAIAARHVTRVQPDLVHTYFFWSIMYGRAMKALGKVRVLVENREDQGFSWRPRDYALLRVTRSLPDRVICVSEAVRQVVLEREQLDPSRVMVIHNGVEIPLQRPGSSDLRTGLGLRPEHLVVGMVANFNRAVKGVRYLIEAVPAIVGAVPEARFVLLGRGRQETELRQLAVRLGVGEHVIFAGYAERVEEYYRLMDISVLTSLSEGLSITLLESMSHGLPVVVTRVGGNPEVVVDGETGYLVPPKDTPVFVDRVVRLLKDDELRAQFGAAARRRVELCFSLDNVAERYLQAYEEVLPRATAAEY